MSKSTKLSDKLRRKPSKKVDKRKLKTLYFNKHTSIRLSKDMISIMDSWISDPRCVDEDGKALYGGRSHFIKSSLVRMFNELKNKYEPI